MRSAQIFCFSVGKFAKVFRKFVIDKGACLMYNNARNKGKAGAQT